MWWLYCLFFYCTATTENFSYLHTPALHLALPILFADRRLLSLEDHLALEEPIVDVIRRDSIDLSVPARVYADFYAPQRTALVLEKALIDLGWDIIFFPAEPDRKRVV